MKALISVQLASITRITIKLPNMYMISETYHIIERGQLTCSTTCRLPSGIVFSNLSSSEWRHLLVVQHFLLHQMFIKLLENFSSLSSSGETNYLLYKKYSHQLFQLYSRNFFDALPMHCNAVFHINDHSLH